MNTTETPVIQWKSPKRVLGKTLFEMLRTSGEMIDSFIKHGLLEKATGNYSLDVYDMCRNGATWLSIQLEDLLGDSVQVVEGTFMGSSHCWVVLEDYYFDMTIAQIDSTYPEFACVLIKDAKGYSEFIRFSVADWIKMNLKHETC